MRGRAVTITLCACAGLLVPASAGADVESAGGFKYVTFSQNVSGGITQLEARCPGGTHVLAGGYDIKSDYEEAGALDFPIDGNDPDDTLDDGWGVVVGNFGGGLLGLDVTATCSKAKPKYRFDSFPVAAGQQARIVPACNGNEMAIDLAVVEADVALNSAVPTQDGSFPAYVDNHEDEAVSVDTVVVCLKAQIKLRNRSVDIAGQTHDTWKVRCPKDWFAVSSGQSNGGSFGQITQTSSSTVSSTRSIIGLDNLTAGPIGVRAVALCMKPVGDTTIFSRGRGLRLVAAGR